MATTIFFLLVSGATAQDAVIHIDVAHQGHPISKYVYGQFIEHFGDCIDIGLWAEIVRDRKFFDAVGDGDSPWKASGAELTMDENDPFTGKWTPVLALKEGEPGVLCQENLRLRAGVDFVGYLWVRPSKGVSRISVSLGGGPEGAKTEWTTDRLAANEYQKLSFSWTAGTAEPFEACFRSGRRNRNAPCRVCFTDAVRQHRRNACRHDRLPQELNSPIYRWPGGNFVSGYN